MAVQVQPALEFDIAVHARGLADQRIDAGRPGIACEHDGSDSALESKAQERPRRSTERLRERRTSRRPELTLELSHSGLKLAARELLVEALQVAEVVAQLALSARGQVARSSVRAALGHRAVEAQLHAARGRRLATPERTSDM